MNWNTGILLIVTQALATLAVMAPRPPYVVPGGPEGLFIVSSLFCLLWPIYLYRPTNRLPRSGITTEPEGGIDQKGLGKVQEADPVCAPAQRWSHSEQGQETPPSPARKVWKGHPGWSDREREVIARMIEHGPSAWWTSIMIVDQIRNGARCHPKCPACLRDPLL